MKAGTLRERIGGDWCQRADGWWTAVAPGRIREAAGLCLEAGARFCALVACPDETGGLRLSWHWDLSGTLLSLRASFQPGTTVPSIVHLCPGADWAERETRDYYGVTFEGRDATPPLVRREGDAAGIMLRAAPERRRPE